MSTIMITGSTDGIGLETAKHLASLGHQLVLHGRTTNKLDATSDLVEAARSSSVVAAELADLSDLQQVDALAASALGHGIDVLINNAGIFNTPEPITSDGLDVRFVVNTVAPYRLTRLLLPSLPAAGRVVNLSSAAQAPVDLDALEGRRTLDHGTAYAQSKLALTMWTRALADELGDDGPVVVAVNPGSFLATKMVKEGYGMSGHDVGQGVDILTRAATSAEFAHATGRYFDNDAGRFADPHSDALSEAKNGAVVDAVEGLIDALTTG